MARARSYPHLLILMLAIFPCVASSQSQVQDARIEGVTVDTDGGSLPNVAVSVLCLSNGTRRTALSGTDGSFQFPLLPLGTYTVSAENPGFRRYTRTGLVLTAGRTATVEIKLEPGPLSETVSVLADSPIVDPSKYEISRNLGAREIAKLPLVSRNPFNYSLLQPGSTGRSVGNAAAVRLSNNGLFRRVGILLDGNNNNDATVPGFRLTFLSEVLIQEMQLLTSGYSAEFGNTAGSIINVITPSGTNDIRGSLRVSARPGGLGAPPFEPPFSHFDPRVSGWDVAGKFSGPIVRDRWHFYTGFEIESRNIPQLITVSEENRAVLVSAGISPEIFQGKADTDRLAYFIFRSDMSTGRNSRLAVRFTRFDNDFLGALAVNQYSINTTERSFDSVGWGQTVAVQFVSAFSTRAYNELRFQRAERHGENVANENTGNGVSITIPGVANLGPPTNLGGSDSSQSSTGVQNATTLVFGADYLKFGGGFNLASESQSPPVFTQYSFNSAEAFARAFTGLDPRSYVQFSQSFGRSRGPLDAGSFNLFAQLERRVTARFRITAGLRYDLFVPPKGDPDALLVESRNFSIDRNNVGPRLGASYVLIDGRYRTVIRAGIGLHYDSPSLKYYRQARLNNGGFDFVTIRLRPANSGAPDFPNRLPDMPVNAFTGTQDVYAVSPGVKTMYAVHSNLQLETSLGDDASVTFGFLGSLARQIAVYRNANCLPLSRTLSDGRPVFGTIGNPCSSRVFPQFGLVMMLESGANMNYRGAFVQVAKRFSGRTGLDLSYTYATARDDAPEDFGNSPGAISDPSNRRLDYGASIGDVRHVLRGSFIAEPRLRFKNEVLSKIFNGFQIGAIVMADSGEIQNIVTNLDLNRDGVFGAAGPDRPVGIPRNSIRIPPFFNMDMKLSRSFAASDKASIQVFAEASNAFNGKFVSGYTTLLPPASVDPVTGQLVGGLPDFSQTLTSWRSSRQVLLGATISF